MKRNMNKKAYIAPQMEVVMIQQSGMICGSPAVRGLSSSSSDGFTMPKDGTLDDDDDDF
jgi:hypothetical protein